MSQKEQHQFDRVAELGELIGYTFKNPLLAIQALTHSSHANEFPDSGENYERLEYLGDAVIELCISERLFRLFPNQGEGELTRLRAVVVQEKSLAEIASGLDLGRLLLLGKGEESSGGRTKPSILADIIESITAAVLLDGGYEAARATVENFIDDDMLKNAIGEFGADCKSKLQEVTQAKDGTTPTYRICSSEGPDHEKTFVVEVSAGAELLGRGSAGSKKSAEQKAARAALKTLNAGCAETSDETEES